MATGFEKASLSQDAGMFKECLLAGLNHSKQDFFRRTPIFGLRCCHQSSKDELVSVLRAFIDGGADIDHVDSFGNTLLLMTETDNLGVALVEVGARIDYDWGI